MIKKSISIFLVALLLLVSFSGCGKKISKEEVQASEYYIELQKKYNSLKKKNNTLKKQLEQAQAKSPDEERVNEVFESLNRNSLVKIEVAYGSKDADSYVSENAGILRTASEFTNNANLITGLDVNKIKLKHDLLYRYYFYDEDNATYEIDVYEGDFVVFFDLPDQVFQVPEASDLGDGFLKQLSYTPQKGFYALMSEATVLLYKDKVLNKKNVLKTVSYLDTMEKTKLKKEPAKAKITRKYEFYSAGELIELGIGANVIHLEGQGKDLWYKITAEHAQELQGIVEAK